MSSTFITMFYHRHSAYLRLFTLACGLLSTTSALGDELAETPAQAANTHTEWRCDTASDGSWACAERSVPGQAYAKPPHRTSKRTASVAPKDEPRVKVPRNLDWVDEVALSDEQKQALSIGCCGAYVEPPRNYPDAELHPDRAPLRASATSTEAQDEVATMKGDVQISQGFRQVRSDVVILDQKTRSASLEGNVQFREPGLLMLGKDAHFNLDSGAIAINEATWVFHESGARGTARTLTRAEDDIFYIDNTTYTTCEPDNNTWSLATSRIEINPESGMATARHVRINVKDVPIIYLPWIRFPVDDRRASGLLFPAFGLSDENGFDFAQPIYLNLAPNYDATITPRYLQERGEMFELEMRHLSAVTETTFGGAWLGNDKGGNDSDEDSNINPATQERPFQGENRWLANIDHHGGFGSRLNTLVDYTKVSDEDYFQDIGNASLQASSETHLKQQAALSYRLDHWNFAIEGTEYQTIIKNADRQYQQVPKVNANGEYRVQTGSQDILFSLKNQYTVFDHINDSFVTGSRFRSEYAASLDKQWLWGYFRPTLKLKHLSYALDDPIQLGGDDSPSTTVPVAILDTGLFFERSTALFNDHIQTLEPRLYYVNAKEEDQNDNPVFDTDDLTFSYQQLFRDERFSGGDRISDAQQVTAAVTSRLIDNSTGIERMRVSLGQVFYLDDRKVALNKTSPNNDLLSDNSDIAAEYAAYLSKDWRFQSDILYNKDSELVNKGSLNLRYRGQDRGLFNASYRYTREDPRFINSREFNADIEQADISTYLPLNNSWNLIGRWNQDVTNSRELEVFAGIEYNSCCWSGAVIFRHWLDRDDNILIPEEELQYDDGIFIQIQLRGLAGTGKGIDSILSDGIYGYEAQ